MSGAGAMDASRPLVSVLMLAYNHAAYIREALNSCLAQERDFPLEIIVCDDASTDGTVDILREYAARHECIVLSLQAFNTGAPKNMLDGLRRIRGKYVAFCEGDDYWTNPRKLHKQVAFLEDNPDFSICCHRVEMLFEPPRQGENKQYVYKNCESEEARIRDGVFYADEAIANYYFHTSSMVFRWRFGAGLPAWFRASMCLDQFLFMLHAVEGKIKYFADDMSVWRRHEHGYTQLQNIDKGLFFTKKGLDWIELYKEMDVFFSCRFTLQIRERILLVLRNIADLALRNGQLNIIRELVASYGEYFEKPVLENAAMLDGLRLAFPEKREFQPPWSTAPLHAGDGATRPDQADGCEPGESVGRCPGDRLGAAVLDIPEAKGSVWDHWTGKREYAFFSSADQALLAWLWAEVPRKQVWLPHYYPASAHAVLRELAFAVRVYAYPMDDAPPSLDFLRLAEDGEAFVSMDFLGKSIHPELARAILDRPGIRWLDDRRHALLPERESQAHAVLQDATTFFGLPDGAVLYGAGMARLQPHIPARHSEYFQDQVWNGLLLLEGGRDVAGAIREKARLQAAKALPAQAGSRLSREILKRLPMRAIAEARRANWDFLAAALGEHAYWPRNNVDFAPLGFPVCLPDTLSSAELEAVLRSHGIFCPDILPGNGVLRVRVCVLPCDQTCSRDDLARMAELVKRFLTGGMRPDDLHAAPR